MLSGKEVLASFGVEPWSKAAALNAAVSSHLEVLTMVIDALPGSEKFTCTFFEGAVDRSAFQRCGYGIMIK